MRLPGFSAEAGLTWPSQKYSPARTFAIVGPRTGVELANIISGGCNPNATCGTYKCADVWDTCQYYAAATSHSGADVSGCCNWWVSCCESHPPSSGGGGGGNGGPPPHHGPVAQ
jgi:hypothetical protein